MALQILLESHDVWFFRTSRPFGAAQAAAADGEAELLPLPSVVFGALRTALGEAAGPAWDWERDYHAPWKAWAGGGPLPAGEALRLGPPRWATPWPVQSLRLAGCVAARVRGGEAGPAAEPLFPLPAFVLTGKDVAPDEAPKREQLRLALPRPSPGRFAGSRAGLWPVMGEGTGAGDDFPGESRPLLIGRQQLVDLLAGRGPEYFAELPTPPGHLAEVEPRIGIARDTDLRRARDGQLYSLGLHRWKSRASWGGEDTYGLLARVEGVEREALPPQFALHLGGERRLAWGRVAVAEPWLSPEDRAEVREAVRASAGRGGWWVVLATPAGFRAGWRPAWVQEGPPAEGGWRARLPGGAGTVDAGRLRGFAANDPQHRSGWDLASRCPKPVRTYLTPGAAWFFELDADPPGEVLDALDALQGACIADDESYAGFGLAFVGAWRRGPEASEGTPQT